MSTADDRASRLDELEEALRSLLGCFDHQAERELEFGTAWSGVQAAFLRWQALRVHAKEVSAAEREQEEECQLLYATVRSVVDRTRDGVGVELDSLRKVRTKIRAAADRRPAATSRAVDLHG